MSPRIKPEVMTVTFPGKKETKYVPLTQFEALMDERDNLNRTLALAHMHLFERDYQRAVDLIERTMGWGHQEAQALRDIVNSVMTAPREEHP